VVYGAAKKTTVKKPIVPNKVTTLYFNYNVDGRENVIHDDFRVKLVIKDKKNVKLGEGIIVPSASYNKIALNRELKNGEVFRVEFQKVSNKNYFKDFGIETLYDGWGCKYNQYAEFEYDNTYVGTSTLPLEVTGRLSRDNIGIFRIIDENNKPVKDFKFELSYIDTNKKSQVFVNLVTNAYGVAVIDNFNVKEDDTLMLKTQTKQLFVDGEELKEDKVEITNYFNVYDLKVK
ncbi:MAG: hypothetical protein N2448_01140, partial [Caloramator sp.]|nr:hypothetical protein [Caloramator sp.]